MYDGIINVYKEKGFTSHDVVAKMRGILGQRKIGHTGTRVPSLPIEIPCTPPKNSCRGLWIRRRKVFFRCAQEKARSSAIC